MKLSLKTPIASIAIAICSTLLLELNLTEASSTTSWKKIDRKVNLTDEPADSPGDK
jgi:hypothetical protein